MKVVDRRRFDEEGNARPEAEPMTTQVSESYEAEPAAAVRDDAEVAQLRADLDAARRRVDELARGLQAMDRDKDEFKARLSRERERLIDHEKGQVAQVLLEAIDEFDLCLAASAEDRSPLAKGVRLIREAILKKVQGAGIERLNLLGLPYDPNTAEASDAELTLNPDDDQKVLSEIRAGYALNGKVIRPARVRIARYVKPADA
jgi:molecular chaperone GrpE